MALQFKSVLVFGDNLNIPAHQKDFEDQINTLVSQGWILHGSPSINTTLDTRVAKDGFNYTFFQALTLEVE